MISNSPQPNTDDINRLRILETSINDEAELNLIMIEVEKLVPEIMGLKGFEILDKLSEIRRAGWIRPEVGIPYHLAETVLEHSLNLKTACECIIVGTPNLVKNHKDFARMAKIHDITEYHNILPDITPHCLYTQKQKNILEKYSVLVLKQILKNGGEKDIKLLEEYIKQETSDSQLLHLYDKVDAGIQAFKYESMGFKQNVAHFHPYNLEKIKHDSYLTMIYEIMLEREFGERYTSSWERNKKIIDPHMQYFELLRLGGNVDEWKKRMNCVLEGNYSG